MKCNHGCGIKEGKYANGCLECTIYLLTKEKEQLKTDLLTLWTLIDDISTAGDMFKPVISPYFKYVNITCDKRSSVATSDGYELFYYGEALK